MRAGSRNTPAILINISHDSDENGDKVRTLTRTSSRFWGRWSTQSVEQTDSKHSTEFRRHGIQKTGKFECNPCGISVKQALEIAGEIWEVNSVESDSRKMIVGLIGRGEKINEGVCNEC